MGLFRDRAPEVDHSARGFTAAATVIDLTDESEKRRIKKGPQQWQAAAWRWYDELGEISDAAGWVSNGLSRVRLVPALIDEPGASPTILREDELDETGCTPEEYQILKSQLERLKGPDGGHSELNRLGALNLWIAGDCHILGEMNKDTGEETFDVLSVDELIAADPKTMPDGSKSSAYARRTGPSTGGIGNDNAKPIPADAFICRIWRRHPRWSSWPNSAMRAANQMCESLYTLTDAINATAQSRIPQGLLLMPNTMEFGPVDITDETGDGEATNMPFANDLMHHLTTAVKDPASAARLAPYVVTGDAVDLKEIRLLEFSKTFDGDMAKLREETLGRLAVSLDLPAEVLTGKANLNHWTAWTIDEEAFKFHLEPLMIVWAMGLTSGWYRPNLELAGLTDPGRFCIWYDPTDLVSHPDDIDTILKVDGARISIISDAAIRRAAGISEDDKPEAEEIGQRIAMDQALRARTTITETAGQLIKDAGGTPPPGTPMTPPAPVTPVQGPPPAGPPAVNTAPPAKMALTASVGHHAIGARLGRIEQSVFLRVRQAANDSTRRALERAGARLRSMAAKKGMGATVKDADVLDIAGLLGQRIIEGQLATSATDLLDGSFASLFPDWQKWTLAAQLAALRAAGIDTTDYETDPRLAEARAAGWDVLVSGLMAAAAQLLYTPNLPAPARGEYDDTTLVNAKTIRDALEAAGGGPTEDGKGSLLFGQSMLDIYTVADLSPSGYVWVYGDEYRQHGFDGHEQLEEVEFADWEDEVLAVQEGDDWVGDYYAPQDHDGCCCGFYRNVVEGTDTQADEEAA